MSSVHGNPAHDPHTASAAQAPQLDTAAEVFNFPGTRGTRLWRALPCHAADSFQADAQALALMLVCMAMGEVVMRRADLAHPSLQDESREASVQAWISPLGHTRITALHTVQQGLAGAWDRRLPQEGWEGPPPAVGPPPWDRCPSTAQAIVALLCPRQSTSRPRPDHQPDTVRLPATTHACEDALRTLCQGQHSMLPRVFMQAPQ